MPRAQRAGAADSAARRAHAFERRQNLSGEAATEEIREAALTLLDHCARSSGELKDRLCRRGYRGEEVSRVVARLVEVGLVDDHAYAQMLVRTRFAERGLVGRALIEEMRRKHLPQDVIDAALAEVEDTDASARALELARKKLGQTPHSVGRERAWARCAAYLARRGYSPSVAREAVRTAWEERQA